jgi:hypothetical protein
MKKRVLTALLILTEIFLLSASIVWAQDAPVAKTGQTTSYATGDDGDLQKGVASPDPRFIDYGDGTVLDSKTGLMWAKNANLDNGTMTWNDAIDYANGLSLGTSCGSPRTDWRLPNRFELESLLDLGNIGPVLPSGHPFLNALSTNYWSSTTYAGVTNSAWDVSMLNGYVKHNFKTNDYYVWPVRGGN